MGNFRICKESKRKLKRAQSSPIIGFDRDREDMIYTMLSFVGCACVGCMQAFVTQNGDYLMLDNTHKLKTRAETVSTLTLHPRLILAK